MSLIFFIILKLYTSKLWHQISLDRICCLGYNKYIQTDEIKVSNAWFSSFVKLVWYFVQNRYDLDHVLYITYCVHNFYLKVLRNIVWWSMILAISCKEIIFLSITWFCCVVIGKENSWKIPCFSRKFSNDSFSNSPPWLLLTFKIFNSFSVCTWIQKVLNTSYASPLVLKNFTQVHLL